MCGRFTITIEPAVFQQEFDLGNVPSEWTPRYNAAPSQPIPIVRNSTTRDVDMLRWGLIPFWAKEEKIGYRLINARSETVHEEASFKYAFKKRRCLILADGFFEWQKSSTRGTPKAPYYFYMKNRKPITFAGLWESWQPKEGREIQTCTILTCPPNEMIAKVHHRMPVMLGPTRRWEWLLDQKPENLLAMLQPFPVDEMESHPVSQRVNSPTNDDPTVIQPLVA